MASATPAWRGARADPLIEHSHAIELSGFFKMLGNDIRLQLLHALVRAREMCVTDLAAELPHGCPFSSFVWRRVVPLLSPDHRCIAPDLLGLGDTETPKGAAWSLRARGAVAQLLAAENGRDLLRVRILTMRTRTQRGS